MAKKPIQKKAKSTPKKKTLPKASKKTKEAINIFDDNLPLDDMYEEVPFKISPAAGKQPMPSIREVFFKWVEGKGSFIILALTTAGAIAVVHWMMVQ